MRGLFHLTWLEIKIFLREPLGAIGSVVIPVVVYLGIGRTLAPRMPQASANTEYLFYVGAPVFAAMMIMLSSVLSLVTIIAIYREGGILKRLRATPLRPWTILTAHVLAKLLFTAATLLLMVLAGRRYYPVDLQFPIAGFTAALLLATWSTLSIGFVIASVVKTARFAQPAGALLFYPMIALSGLFFPVSSLSPGLRAVARLMPLTYVVSLLTGILKGEPWSAHLLDVGALVLVFAVCMALSARLFRWE
jgi:ABC-2 type transport system permease protein